MLRDFKPLKIEQSVQTAWRELAELVWRKDLDEHNIFKNILRGIKIPLLKIFTASALCR